MPLNVLYILVLIFPEFPLNFLLVWATLEIATRVDRAFAERSEEYTQLWVEKRGGGLMGWRIPDDQGAKALFLTAIRLKETVIGLCSRCAFCWLSDLLEFSDNLLQGNNFYLILSHKNLKFEDKFPFEDGNLSSNFFYMNFSSLRNFYIDRSFLFLSVSWWNCCFLSVCELVNTLLFFIPSFPKKSVKFNESYK